MTWSILPLMVRYDTQPRSNADLGLLMSWQFSPAGHIGFEWDHTNPALGSTQIQAKIMTKLTSTDKACAQRVKKVWGEMLTTTLRDKDGGFASLEEYVDFRVIDAGTS